MDPEVSGPSMRPWDQRSAKGPAYSGTPQVSLTATGSAALKAEQNHPNFLSDCTQFYECYWDKWIEKFTLHIFPCPVAMAVRQYDESISACNWPFLGPNCEAGARI